MALQNSNQSQNTGTLVARVMQEIRGRIASHRLGAGARVPSIRQMAARMNVSKSTVVDAYDRLTAEGVIQARKGAGFYVSIHQPPLHLATVGPQVPLEIDPLWVSRQSLEAAETTLKPGCGWLPADWMPQASLRRALRTMARSEDALLTDYGTPHGFAPLREYILRRMMDVQIMASPEQVMLTSSGTQSLDLVCRFLLEPGDTVLVDDPCYFNFHALLKAHQVKVVSVPYTVHGPDLDQFEEALHQHRPRLYITNSAIHNPTGATLSPVVAHQVLKLAEQADLIIVEDDIFADFETTSAPRLAALDGLQRVIHIGSFSKTLSAAARCGFIAARSDWIDGLVDLKIATSFGGDPFSAELTWRVLTDGSYRKYLEELRRRLSKAMDNTGRQLSEVGISPWIKPQAGLYLWCALPPHRTAIEVAQQAHAQGIVLAPGNVFSLTETAGQFLRFNVAQSGSPKIYTALKEILAE